MHAKALRVGDQVLALSQRLAGVLSSAGEDFSFASFLCCRYLERKFISGVFAMTASRK